MSHDDPSYSPPAGTPPPEGDGSDAGRLDPEADRLPPPIFAPGVNRRILHRSSHLPPAAASLPRDVVYGPNDPPRSRKPPTESTGREARADELATLLETLAGELRQSGTLRFTSSAGSDRVEASLRGFLSGVLVSGVRDDIS